MLEPKIITLLPPKITVAWHLTKIVMHPEPIETGDAEEQVSVMHPEPIETGDAEEQVSVMHPEPIKTANS